MKSNKLCKNHDSGYAYLGKGIVAESGLDDPKKALFRRYLPQVLKTIILTTYSWPQNRAEFTADKSVIQEVILAFGVSTVKINCCERHEHCLECHEIIHEVKIIFHPQENMNAKQIPRRSSEKKQMRSIEDKLKRHLGDNDKLNAYLEKWSSHYQLLEANIDCRYCDAQYRISTENLRNPLNPYIGTNHTTYTYKFVFSGCNVKL